VPVIARIFDVVPLNGTQWVCTMLISIAPLFIMELQKKINEIRFGKVIYSKQKAV
jgi:Ca2+-transporting ATPase